MTRPHEKLLAWQKAMELVKRVYVFTGSLPKEEQFGLTSQMRRAAVSVPCNVAEGAARETAAEFARFLYIARGSLSELETLIRICLDLGVVDDATEADLRKSAEHVGRLVEGLIARNKANGVREAPPSHLS